MMDATAPKRASTCARRRRSWRFRRCPACGIVNGAGGFAVVGSFWPGWTAGANLLRECPFCRYRAPTWRFVVVRERHT